MTRLPACEEHRPGCAAHDALHRATKLRSLEAWHCRIGINSGPVIKSLVGVQKHVYDICGPGVNLAARMETLSEPTKITVRENTYNQVKDDFHRRDGEDFAVKGFSDQTPFFFEHELPTFDSADSKRAQQSG